jgi:hypothetical protein
MVAACLLFLLVNFANANPYLVAKSPEWVDYYIISIGGQESSLAPSFGMMFFYNLHKLNDGLNKVHITPVDSKYGAGQTITFSIRKTTRRRFIIYRIKRHSRQSEGDPLYYERFGTLKVRIWR